MLRYAKTYLLVSSFLLLAGCNVYQLASTESETHEIQADSGEDQAAEQIIAEYRIELDDLMNEVINTADHDLTIGSPESTLGNFCADLTQERAIEWVKSNSSDAIPAFSVLNSGGLRTPILKGDITVRNIYELMPFENEIVLVEITGVKMIELVNYVIDKSAEEGRKAGVPLSSSFRLEIEDKPDEPFELEINNQKFDSRRNYVVATTDYLANGGDHMDFFAAPVRLIKTGIKFRDAIIDHVKALAKDGKTVSAKLDGRVEYD